MIDVTEKPIRTSSWKAGFVFVFGFNFLILFLGELKYTTTYLKVKELSEAFAYAADFPSFPLISILSIYYKRAFLY